MSGFRVGDPRFGRLVDRNHTLGFSFDGKRLRGLKGDTLASALLASGVPIVARSFKLHRPRGISSIGPDEPNALFTAQGLPNRVATGIPLADGLVTKSQGGWPNAARDFKRVADRLHGLLPSGFQYKVMKWPARLWPVYEKALRRSTVFGRAPQASGTRAEHVHMDVDVLVVGGGVAGIVAAETAAAAGLSVLLAEQSDRLGGVLDGYDGRVDGLPLLDWMRARVAHLAQSPNVHLLTRTRVSGLYDHGFSVLVEDRPEGAEGGRISERLWKLRAGTVVLATGAQEKPFVFPGNDRPGVMLAQAARLYLRRYGIAPGRRVLIATSGDEGYRTALDLAAAGVEIARVVDLRLRPDSPLHHLAKASGIPVVPGSAPVEIRTRRGGSRITGAVIENRLTLDDAPALRTEVGCDCVLVSGGFAPVLQLCGHLGMSLPFDAVLGAHVAGDLPPGLFAAGAANGVLNLAEVVADARRTGVAVAHHFGLEAEAGDEPQIEITADDAAEAVGMLPDVATRAQRFAAFLDPQNDVTAGDLALAVEEGYRAPEHFKRYTGAGLGTDQGRGVHANSAMLRAAATGDAAHTTHRPPWQPISFSAIAGARRGMDFSHAHRGPIPCGPATEAAGAWDVAAAYPGTGESGEDAARREALAARRGLGVMDVSHREKIRLWGPDAVRFLERVCHGGIAGLDPLQARPLIFLDPRGHAFARAHVMAEYSGAFSLHVERGHLFDRLERLARIEHRDLAVALADETERWADILLVGPLADSVSSALPEYLPPAAWLIEVSAFGGRGHLLRLPAGHAEAIWQRLIGIEGAAPVGHAARRILDVECGEAPFDVWREYKAGELGLLAGEPVAGPRRLVGIVTAGIAVPVGSHLVAGADRDPPRRMLGHVVASEYSPLLRRPVMLAVVDAAISEPGARADIRHSGEVVTVEVVPAAAVTEIMA